MYIQRYWEAITDIYYMISEMLHFLRIDGLTRVWHAGNEWHSPQHWTVSSASRSDVGVKTTSYTRSHKCSTQTQPQPLYLTYKTRFHTSVHSSEGLIAVIMRPSSSNPTLTAGSLLFEGEVTARRGKYSHRYICGWSVMDYCACVHIELIRGQSWTWK